MTPRQEKFCVEYLINLNATQAAIRAGYSEKTAYSMGQRLLKNVEIKSRIKELQDKVFEDGMMSAAEALWRLSKAGRGELKEEVVVTEGIGDGFSEAKIIKKQIYARYQIKALYLYGSYSKGTQNPDSDIDIAVIVDHIEGDYFEYLPLNEIGLPVPQN